MTPGEFKEYAKTMCEFGISSLTMKDEAIIRGEIPLTAPSRLVPISESQSSNEQEDPIQHKTEQLTSLLKLNDTDLVDQLFPDHRTNTEVSER